MNSSTPLFGFESFQVRAARAGLCGRTASNGDLRSRGEVPASYSAAGAARDTLDDDYADEYVTYSQVVGRWGDATD